jgi:hypothetical protein
MSTDGSRSAANSLTFHCLLVRRCVHITSDAVRVTGMRRAAECAVVAGCGRGTPAGAAAGARGLRRHASQPGRRLLPLRCVTRPPTFTRPALAPWLMLAAPLHPASLMLPPRSFPAWSRTPSDAEAMLCHASAGHVAEARRCHASAGHVAEAMLGHASAGHVAKGRPPAQLLVAGVLAAYAAQLRAAADFSPAWPRAFPEHLRSGSGRMSASKARLASECQQSCNACGRRVPTET